MATTDGPPAVTERELQALQLLATAVWIVDVQQRMVRFANRAGLRLWGTPDLESLRARDLAAEVCFPTVRRLGEQLERLRGGARIDETWALGPTGALTVPCSCSAVALEGGPLCVLVEARLPEEVDLLGLRGVEALRHTTVMITMCDMDGAVLMQNPAAAESFPRRATHALRSRLCDPGEAEHLLETLRRGGVVSGEVLVRTRQGQRWHALEARHANDPAGGGQVILINEQDVTPLKLAEQDLVRAREQLEERVQARTAELQRLAATLERERSFLDAVLDTVSAVVLVVGADGRIERANRAALERTSLEQQRLVGRPVDELLRADGDAPLAPDPSGRPGATREARLLTAGGDPRLLALSVAELPRTGAGPGHVIVTGVDVTEQRDLQLRLQMSDRLVTLGTLAAGVAHDINNPLAYALASLQLLDEELARAREADAGVEAARLSELAREVLGGVLRVREIVQELNAFQRAMGDRVGAVDLHAVLRSAIKLTDNETRHRARVVLELDPVPPVEARASRLGQVFLNLLVNAAQALPEGAAEQHRIVVRTRTDDEGDAVVEVADSGPGIPARDLPRIFEPYFTTKSGTGGGLGLFISRRIVEEAGGAIEAASPDGGGARFRVHLPATAAPPAPRAVRREPEDSRHARRGRILVIDDEPGIARSLRRVLRGHEVVAAASGREGLELLAEGRYDVVFCDLMMPDLTGMDVFQQVERRRPELAGRIVFMTGGAFTQRAREFLDRVSNQRVAKPFDIDEVRRIVSTLLQ